MRFADSALLITRALVTPIELVIGKRVRRPAKYRLLVILSTSGVELLLLIELLLMGVGQLVGHFFRGGVPIRTRPPVLVSIKVSAFRA